MTTTNSRLIMRFASLLALLCSFMLPAFAAPQDATAQTAPAQKTFATAQQAADAIVKAASDGDLAELSELLGPDGKDLVSSADPVQDKNNLLSFVEMAKKKTKLSISPALPNVAVLVVGDDDWPMPIPVVKKNGRWLFDTKSGKTEILYRRIGSNELDAIAICRNYVLAQLEYASTRHDGGYVNQYAQKILSSPGKQDGLYWKNANGTDGGPLNDGIAKAIAEGYNFEQPAPYHGYYFKVLKGQGPAAPIGTIDYVIQGAMIGGFALVAVPAQYRVTGVQTFIISQDGIVYQKDLGPDSLKIAKEMELYNPDKTWHETDAEWPDTTDTASQ